MDKMGLTLEWNEHKYPESWYIGLGFLIEDAVIDMCNIDLLNDNDDRTFQAYQLEIMRAMNPNLLYTKMDIFIIEPNWN